MDYLSQGISHLLCLRRCSVIGLTGSLHAQGPRNVLGITGSVGGPGVPGPPGIPAEYKEYMFLCKKDFGFFIHRHWVD